jgi:hypothetical protein
MGGQDISTGLNKLHNKNAELRAIFDQPIVGQTFRIQMKSAKGKKSGRMDFIIH